MRLTALFGVCLLGLASTAPTFDGNKIVITEDYFPESLVVATTQHDVVSILVPLNNINFGDDVLENEDIEFDITLFFVEADTDAQGKKDYKGLYALKNKKVTKLLDEGTDATADSDNSVNAYFSAKDGIYKYNFAENKAEKYGSVDDSIIGIAKVNATDLFYILTEDHVVYKVVAEGTKKEKIAEVTNAQQIVLDNENNLYFYTPSKEVFVVNAGGVKKIVGLPTASVIDLVRPPFLLESGIPVVLDKQTYVVYPNGTSELDDVEVNARPTAYSMEAVIFHYYAYDKKIYEYNLLELIMGGLFEAFNNYFEDNYDSISTVSSSNLKSKKHK